MIDERDLSLEKEWFYEERAKRVAAAIQKRGMNAQYVASREEALPVILGMIHEGATVVRGDSVTLDQVGVIAELRNRKQIKFIDPFETNPDGTWRGERKERIQKMKEAVSCDVFVTGTNAITLDGKLVNIDGAGNRVSPLIWGPEKVIVVAGVNKIVKDVDEALERIHTVAAPMNARRHFLKHHIEAFGDLPCVRTGRCVDYNHDMKICNYVVIIQGAMLRQRGRINVVLVGEELGL